MNIISPSFRDAIRAAGLQPPEHILPGQLYRFPGRGKNANNQAGWCILFEDCQSGAFGDWSSGLNETWFAVNSQAPDVRHGRLQNQPHRPNWNQARKLREKNQKHAARRALQLWNKATKAVDHPYLKLKGIRPYGARILRSILVLSIIDFDDELTSLQFIDTQGGKRMLMGGRKQGCFIPVVGKPESFTKLFICEGYATGCTLGAMNPGSLIIAAIDAGNLKAVAINARRRWPLATIVIAGDDDRQTEGNPGRTKATEAAKCAKAHLMMPEWPEGAPEDLTDFNDLAKWIKEKN